MSYGRRVTNVLERTMVAEFVTLTRTGLNVRPLAPVWLPDSGQLLFTTPIGYAQKVLNVRRDPRVAVLLSDPTGSGLGEAPNVLVQGYAAAPEVVAGPADVPEFWRGVFGKHPHAIVETSDPEYRRTMDWYYWRLPIHVTPERVVTLPAEPYGGAYEPPAPWSGTVAERVADALHRYPTAVLAARDATGRPCAARAAVHAADGGDVATLTTCTATPYEGVAGPASLLWHRHDGRAEDMSSLPVVGSLTPDPSDPTRASFRPERVAGASPEAGEGGADGGADEDWTADARRRSHAYLDRHGLTAPAVDWDALAEYAAEARSAAS